MVIKFILYWIIQLTWGIVLTAIGGFITVMLIIFGYKPKVFGFSVFVEFGTNWGGLNLGGFFFVQNGASLSLKQHEYGHSFQNLWLGPLTPFLITIPSAVRYHYRRIKRKKGLRLKPYDSFWCEKWATDLGKKYYKS